MHLRGTVSRGMAVELLVTCACMSSKDPEGNIALRERWYSAWGSPFTKIWMKKSTFPTDTDCRLLKPKNIPKSVSVSGVSEAHNNRHEEPQDKKILLPFEPVMKTGKAIPK
eukprot:4069968-Amphidinium_carterae.1